MKGKTLIVDDEPQMRSMMAEWLTHAGYESLTACDGEEGLISLLKEQPDVAVSDVCMPNMDGYEFCRLAREGSDVAVVLMSGFSS
ncbi:MAG: response regulator [Chloroflexi bacterium]|nr:response regulator [Chloroflexota bacterium]